MDMIPLELFRRNNITWILTSNLPAEQVNCLWVDYDRYSSNTWEEGEDDAAMAVNLLSLCKIKELYIAGQNKENALPDKSLSFITPVKERMEYV